MGATCGSGYLLSPCGVLLCTPQSFVVAETTSQSPIDSSYPGMSATNGGDLRLRQLNILGLFAIPVIAFYGSTHIRLAFHSGIIIGFTAVAIRMGLS